MAVMFLMIVRGTSDDPTHDGLLNSRLRVELVSTLPTGTNLTLEMLMQRDHLATIVQLAVERQGHVTQDTSRRSALGTVSRVKECHQNSGTRGGPRLGDSD